MLISFSLLGIGLLIMAFVYNSISQFKTMQINELEAKKAASKAKFDFMIAHRKELRKELEDKKNTLASLQNNSHGIKTISIKDFTIPDADKNEKISNYLLQTGKITLEQNEKALKQMSSTQLDYLGICLAMGFIDIDTAKKAKKVYNS